MDQRDKDRKLKQKLILDSLDVKMCNKHGRFTSKDVKDACEKKGYDYSLRTVTRALQKCENVTWVGESSRYGYGSNWIFNNSNSTIDNLITNVIPGSITLTDDKIIFGKGEYSTIQIHTVLSNGRYKITRLKLSRTLGRDNRFTFVKRLHVQENDSETTTILWNVMKPISMNIDTLLSQKTDVDESHVIDSTPSEDETNSTTSDIDLDNDDSDDISALEDVEESSDSVDQKVDDAYNDLIDIMNSANEITNKSMDVLSSRIELLNSQIKDRDLQIDLLYKEIEKLDKRIAVLEQKL